jgi:pimeloyl-ACP methyl ester carboxylesterase
MPAVTHAMADIEPGLRLHFVTAGTGERTAVLLHGFPQTWWEWHHVIAPLVDAGFRVVAPDYRGAGHSSRPTGGYDRRSMAKDIHRLLREHLHIKGPVVMIGHDIGLMVAYAYAQAYRSEVSQLAVIDAPLPGTDVFDRLRSDPRVPPDSRRCALDRRRKSNRAGGRTAAVSGRGSCRVKRNPMVIPQTVNSSEGRQPTPRNSRARSALRNLG